MDQLGTEHDLMVETPSASRRGYGPAWSSLLVGLAIFGLLWFLNIPYRHFYQADDNDVTALTDGLLLVPGARWEDWFTQGHSHFFDAYPEWPWGLTPFARPAFQFLIYLAHFVFGRDWSSYLALNYLGVAGVAAVAFAVARMALRVDTGAALLAAALVLLSPAVLEFSIWQVGFASEPLASVLVGCAFLAIVARRDVLCLVLLLIALLTKETAVWAPFAAALSILLRPGSDDTPRRRPVVAGAMLLPVALWLGLRFAFYGGIGGSYATGSYTPLTDFLNLVGWKLTHLHRFLVSQERLVAKGEWAAADRALMIGAALLVLLLLLPWVLRSLRAATDRLGQAMRGRRWPTVDAPLLVALWAAMGFAFDFAVTLDSPRYATAAVMFTWPAVVSEAVERRTAVFRFALAACLVLPLARTAHLLVKFNPPSEQSYARWYVRAAAGIDAALRQVPEDIQEVYILTAGGLPSAAPEYLQAFLDIPVKIIRVVDIHEDCKGAEPLVAFAHVIADGLVTLDAELRADCASFFFDMAGPGSTSLANGGIRRGDSISYELPEAYLIDHKGPLKPALEPGWRITMHIRPHGPARFIVENSGPSGGLVWFDTP